MKTKFLFLVLILILIVLISSCAEKTPAEKCEKITDSGRKDVCYSDLVTETNIGV